MKPSPNKMVGIWIDRSRSVLVSIKEKETGIKEIISGMQKNVRFTGGAFKETEEDIRDRRIRNQFNTYLDKVVNSLSDAGYLLIMGPGNAKNELVKSLIKSRFQGRIVSVETADKMTERQFTARVRACFQESARAEKTKLPTF